MKTPFFRCYLPFLLVVALATACVADKTASLDSPSHGKAGALNETQTTALHETFRLEVDNIRQRVRARSVNATAPASSGAPLYDLHVSIDTEMMTYNGSLWMWARNNSSDNWNELHFHLYPNFEGISGDLKNLVVRAAYVEGKSAQIEDRKTHVVLPLEYPLPPGNDVVVRMEFEGIAARGKLHAPSDSLASLVKELLDLLGDGGGDYGIFAYSSGILSLSLWHPILAAYDAGGWDTQEVGAIGDFSYFDVADFEVTVEAPPEWTLITTGESLEKGKQSRTFAAGQVREFTIMASKNLRALTQTLPGKSPVEIRAWALEGNEETNKRVLKASVDSVKTFQDLFGQYPYGQLDVVQMDLKGGAGGVEFPGLVTLASMLYMDKTALEVPESKSVVNSRFMKETVEFVVAHEVAHQWWNAVVGSHSRNHPFMDEAMANYSAVLYFEHVHGEEAADRQILFQLKLPYQLNRFVGGLDLPVDSPASAFEDISTYSAVVYGKGGLYLKQMRSLLGEKSFYQALSNYYNEFRFKVAAPEDLLRHFKESTDRKTQVDALASRWLEGTQGDKDVGTFNPTIVIPTLLKELEVQLDPFWYKMLLAAGFWESTRLLGNILEGKVDWFDGVRLEIIMEWGAGLAKELLIDLIM